ncbi:MAG: signal peptide peptidase SppA [Vicinamibacterales bacterium]
MALSRPVRFILMFMTAAVVIFFLTGVVAAFLLTTRGPTVQAGSLLWLRVPDNMVERAPDDLLGQLVGRRETVGAVVETLRKAKVDARVEAVVLIPAMQPGLWGKVQEIRDAVLDFKTSGKPIVAYLEYGGGQQYYLATACDQIFLTPTSPLDLVGVASYELFFRGALDKVGAYPDMLHAGEFKTASNVYTETTFTPEHREMTESLNRDLYDQLVDGIAAGRTMTASAVEALIDRGPFLPEEAVRHGLVDGLAYEDELTDRLALADSELKRLSYADYRRVNPRSLGLNRGPQIALVYAVGTITFGGSGTDVTGSEVLGSETLVRAIRDARTDDSIQAIIVRIDSPGGAAIASDIIWRELTLARDDKPIIASMSDVAASGGYYIAMPAHAIVAQSATLTGSIGVVGGKFALGGTFEKIGLDIETVADGKVADINSPVAPYSDDARARLQQQIDAIYETFLDKAAQGRSMTRDAVHAVAQGRVWTGRQAKDLGLVDELGGLARAVTLAKERAGIGADVEVTLVPYPRPRSLFEVVNSSLTVRSVAGGRAWLTSPIDHLLAAVTTPMRLFRPGEPLALMPLVYLN